MYAVSRVKSLARALKSSSAKRQRLGDRFALDYFDDYADGTDEADTLAGWLRNLEILTNTWALAGCFNVQWAGPPVKYAPQTSSACGSSCRKLLPVLMAQFAKASCNVAA